MQIRERAVWMAMCLLLGGAITPAPGVPIQSTFAGGDEGCDEGWTQVNLGGDYRYLDEITFDGACLLHVADGVLTACDPDAGTWMFQAPPKFLGNQSAALDGYLEYAIRWQGTGVADPANPLPNVILVSSNVGIACVLGDPPINQWTPNRIQFDENAGWLWMDDETGMENLPPATRAQIATVLTNVTALRITGEFITGDDTGFLDNVILAGTELDRPRLNIRLLSAGQVEVSWPISATGNVLETNGSLLASGQWRPVNPSGSRAVTFPVVSSNLFFRLRQE